MRGAKIVAVGALLMAVGTIVGAMASHMLATRLSPAQLHSLETAVRFQMFNALGLMVLGVLANSWLPKFVTTVSVLIFLGTLCFSGGIYLMLLGAPSAFGLVTPLGGVLLIGGWLVLGLRLLWVTNPR